MSEQISTPSEVAVPETDGYLKPIPIATFEGAFVRKFEARLPAIQMAMPEGGYQRGMHMILEVEARVRNVSYTEDKRGDLVREHVLALEGVLLREAFDPAERADNNVGGNASGSAEGDEHDHVASYLAGDLDVGQLLELVDIDEEILERLRILTDVLTPSPRVDVEDPRVAAALEDAGIGF